MSIDHIGVNVKSYEDSVRFYEAILAPLGNKKKMTVENDQGRATAFGQFAPTFWIQAAKEGVDPALVKLSGPTHLAFAARDRSAVDAFYKAAIAAGGKCNGPPGLRKYHASYYAAYVIDPDGNNVEAVNHFELFSWKVLLPAAVALSGVAYYYYYVTSLKS